MKATEATLLDFLKKSPQFVIPIYQRTYSWTERECRQLWDDILRTGRKERVPVDEYTIEHILRQNENLSAQAAKVWAAPSLPVEVLQTYRPKVERPAGYSLADHPNLSEDSPMRPVFDAFRKEVLALDPCVTEEFLKRYVAYKAAKNFVDVVPQKSRLRLTLNLQFHELHDPKGLAKDMTNRGRWGNGDVRVAMSDPGELPYVMGLVRQTFEKQTGNGEAES